VIVVIGLDVFQYGRYRIQMFGACLSVAFRLYSCPPQGESAAFLSKMATVNQQPTQEHYDLTRFVPSELAVAVTVAWSSMMGDKDAEPVESLPGRFVAVVVA
jgi:hypothetical protein